MAGLYLLFLNIVLGIFIIILFVFYQGRVKELEKAHREIGVVLEIRTVARTRELRELAEQQEEIIKERTKELREKIEELERFQKLAVGRELKMIELKEEIGKLKEELEKIKGRQ